MEVCVHQGDISETNLRSPRHRAPGMGPGPGAQRLHRRVGAWRWEAAGRRAGISDTADALRGTASPRF